MNILHIDKKETPLRKKNKKSGKKGTKETTIYRRNVNVQQTHEQMLQLSSEEKNVNLTITKR